MSNKRRLLDGDIKSVDMIRYKSEGLTPYYYISDEGKDFGLNELVKPLSHNDRYTKPREIFLLTPDEYEKVNRLVENIREMIELHKKKISLYKELVPSAMNELIKK
jgi:hypothetical protein